MKAFIGPLASSLGALWLFLLIGTILSIRRKQWPTTAWLGLPVLFLTLFAGSSLTERLVASAERAYAPAACWPVALDLKGPIDAVVVLGGDCYASEHDPFGFALGHTASRLLAGVELARVLKPARLVMGGGAALRDEPDRATAALVQNWVQTWGVTGVTVTNLGICADTHAEALQCRKLSDRFGWKRIVLVTSALHMQRSEAVFAKAGLAVVPQACDFQAEGVRDRFSGYSPFPRQERLLMLSAYLHEKVGWLVYRWRGWV